MRRWKAEERALHAGHVVWFGCWDKARAELSVGRHSPLQRERLRKERFQHAADAACVGFLCWVF
jgi:hypothetical protein